MIETRTKPYGAIVVLVVLQLPLSGFLVRDSGLAAQMTSEALFWLFAILILVYVLLVERRPLSSIGLTVPTWKSAAFGVACAVAMIAAMAFCYIVVLPALHLGTDDSQMASVKSLTFGFRLAIIARAAVFEELFYRGFAIERLTELTGLRWLAALISLVAFTFAHLEYWGWAHLLVVTVAGALLTGLYLWKRDLVANMIAHLITDGVGFLLG